MDVKTTFFYDHFHEEIYMAQLEDYVDPNTKTKFCKLLKTCVYGFKQTSRMWYE